MKTPPVWAAFLALLFGKQGDAVEGDGADGHNPQVLGHGGDNVLQRAPILTDDPLGIVAVVGAEGQGSQRQAQKAEPLCLLTLIPAVQIQAGGDDGG